MSKDRLPNRVPLPDVPQHTEDIVFGYLGLPTGFDEERILVNLRAIGRVRSAAGLGVISVTSYRGESQPYDIQISDVDSSGTATTSVIAKRHEKPLANGSVRYPTGSSSYDYPDAFIKIDSTELEARIDEDDSYKRGVFDTLAQAKFLDNGLRQGLRQASRDATFDKIKLFNSAQYYGLISLLAEFASSRPPEIVIGAFVAAGPIMRNLRALVANLSTFDKDKGIHSMQDFRDMSQRLRQSFFVGCEPDRFVAASGIITASRIIKSRK
ncbi:hypothetical protein BVY00_01750 [bacterium G20]|nr:hypothetical protein BVY00_01750 [bacterium G20]